MKDTWEKLGNDAYTVQGEIENLLEMLPASAKMHRQAMTLNKAWNRFKKSMTDMDQFITPVKSVKVASILLNDAEFSAAWKMWKDYLNEQHGLFMRSRAELAGLKKMLEITQGNPKLGVKTLEYCMYRMSPNFYKVNELETKEEPTKKGEGKGTVIKLDAKYSRPKPVFHQKTITEEIKESEK